MMLVFYFALFTIASSSIHATILVLPTNDTYMDRPALFGPTMTHDTSLAGHIMDVAQLGPDRFGCAPLPCPPPSTVAWIALVERGHCSFVTKVRAMQQSNAKAVIIGDPYLNHWLTMYALEDTSDIKIPSVYVAQYQFRALQLHAPTLIELINDIPPFAWTDRMMMILLSPWMMFLIIYFGWKCRAYHDHLNNNVAPCHVVADLPSRSYMGDDDDETCAICLEIYLENEKVRTLPCRHEFHVHCIDPWLTTRKKVCPICKLNVCQSQPQQQQDSEHTPLLPI